jgi:hypothetical protein
VNYQEVINIASKFDAKGFKQAETALTKLSGSAKKVAGSLGLAFGAAAITSYGKAAAKAFADDEAAALRLNRAVENLGIGFANPAIADFISNLEKSAAVADDILRPAFQGLLTTTGSLVQSQKLLNDAITISRASGIDLATVTEDLGKGYVGITRGLSKYNTGLTRAELTSKSFNEILGVILKRSAGAAEDYLDTTAYKFNVLSVASSNASEIIGGGLVDAFALIGGGTDASDAAYVIETIASALAKVTVQTGRTIGVIPTLIANLKKLPREIFSGFVGKQFGVNVNVAPKEKEVKLTVTQKRQQELLAKLEKDSLRRERERLALKNKQLATDKAKAIIAKGEAALLKGETVFDMDKIQLAAALTNQAEQLGKATSAAQMLQIANDTARLNVKKSILALEEAIASKDEASIIAATKKLNADLGVLNALTGQNTQMKAIETILNGLKPKDLINQANLDEALRKIREMMLLLSNMGKGGGGSGGGGGGGGGSSYSNKGTTALIPGVTYNPTQNFDRNYDLLNQLASASAAATVPTFAAITGSGRGAGAGEGQIPRGVSITVNTGVGDPNAIAEAIDQVLNDAINRGTLRGGMFAV